MPWWLRQMRGRACPFKRTFSQPSCRAPRSPMAPTARALIHRWKTNTGACHRGSPLTLATRLFLFLPRLPSFHGLLSTPVQMRRRRNAPAGAKHGGAPFSSSTGVPSPHLRPRHGPRRFVTGSKVNLVFSWRTAQVPGIPGFQLWPCGSANLRDLARGSFSASSRIT